VPIFGKASKRAARSASAGQAERAGQGESHGPVVDPLLGDQVAHRFRGELAEGRWQEYHDFLEGVRDWGERNFYVAALAGCFKQNRPEWIEQWKSARPGSALPFLFSGAHQLDWAWDARGSGRARTVAEDAWPVFHTRLVDADRDLAEAAGIDEQDPTSYAQSIRAALGLGLGLAERSNRFGQVARRDRWHAPAHQFMIQALARKWGGSHDTMFEFARSESAQAPDGSSVHRVVALAHLEQWLDLPRETQDGQRPQRTYFRRHEVAAEVLRAADRSIRSPAYVPSRATPADRNAFAMCFYQMGEYLAQLLQMNLIGPQVTAIPWHYLAGTPSAAYERARTAALARITTTAPTGTST
jgi:hypothetical protein